MRAPHLTPPIALFLPGNLTAHYVPESDPPAYRLDEIGMDIPVDVVIPDDLVATDWYWLGSFLTQQYPGRTDGPSVGIATCTYPPLGWPSEHKDCFTCARELERLRAEFQTSARTRPAKRPKQVKRQAAAVATPAIVQMELF